LAILFDGTPAPILYSSSTQINAVVPFELAQIATVVTIQNGSQTIGPFQLPVVAAVPRLFTVAGTQQVLAVNQDGTVNSTANPAAAGSVITVFISGAGAFDPPLTDGQLGPLTPPFPVPAVGAVQGAIGGASAGVLFAGQAPGQVAGLVQVDLYVPNGTPPGEAQIFLSLGINTSTAGTTFVAVR
jgi:uncharacterized protein (TIGR03437 family)